jgi:alkanesulfonate monooxygenase SsuD/methylene tetrahydromethanopterin reductase-like flavin-dependent oxidoreductase (luciferase family)
VLGVGLGGSRFEFEAVNPKWKNGHRGNILSEQIEVMRLLLTQDNAKYKGEYYEIDGLSFYPKPVQQPLPIYFTGTSSQSMLRVAKWGNGLFLKPNAEEIRNAVESLKPVLEAHKRDLSEIDIALSVTLTIARTHEEAIDHLKRSRVSYRKDHIVGTPSEIIEQVQKLGEVGINHFTAQRFAASSYSELKEQVQMLAEEVMPVFK